MQISCPVVIVKYRITNCIPNMRNHCHNYDVVRLLLNVVVVCSVFLSLLFFFSFVRLVFVSLFLCVCFSLCVHSLVFL